MRSPKGKESSLRSPNYKKSHRELESEYEVKRPASKTTKYIPYLKSRVENISENSTKNRILAGEMKGTSLQELYGNKDNDSISFLSPLQSTISPNDIDYELRLKLKAIHEESLNNSKQDSKILERQSKLLTTRLDALQRELDAKNKIILQFDIMRNEMIKKKDENVDLQGKLFHFEKDTIMLQQELSVMRTSQKEILKPKDKSQILISQCDVYNDIEKGRGKGNEMMKDISPLKPFTTSMNQRVRSPFGQKNRISQSKFLSTPKKCEKNENSSIKIGKVLSGSKKQINKNNNNNEKFKDSRDIGIEGIFPLNLYEIEEPIESVKMVVPEKSYSTLEKHKNCQMNEDKENSKNLK